MSKAAHSLDGASNKAHTLQIKWAEFGGLAASAPTRQGFGTVLLKDVPAAELQAELSLDFHPSGLIFVSQIPLFEITVPVCPSAQT